MSQLEALSLRLSATERALHDANARSADLGGRLVVSEAGAKLAAIESAAKVASAKDGETVAQVCGAGDSAMFFSNVFPFFPFFFLFSHATLRCT